ncbi:GNAT family N-acetyltransferase [bacterium]|nr:GNAT family N-acetyltransferase [candidate division CSSED10-310 bacterium]
MKIRTLQDISRNDLVRLTAGYESNERYRVFREESDDIVVIRLERMHLETPYRKRFESDDAGEYDRYCRYISQGFSLGLFDGDRLEGLAIAEPVDWNRSLWIWEFHIASAHQGCGWGRKMMDILAERAQTRGMRTMVCETQNTNVPAIRFYRKTGFVIDGIDLTYYANDAAPDGEVAVFMKRSLQTDADPNIRKEPVPETGEDVLYRHEANRQAWNEGAVKYGEELAESIAFIRSGKSNMHPVERRNLGDLSTWCETAVHLQCASGQDTLSLVVEGVRNIIGVDISDRHIANARAMSQALGMPARWIRSDVLSIPHDLDGSADLVYTGRGALCWIQALEPWAESVARLLKRDGIFHILDDHPITWLFRADRACLEPSYIDYFNYCESNRGWPESFLGNLGKPVHEEVRKYERLWPISQVVQALIGVGMEILSIGEHPEPYWDNMPELEVVYRRLIPMTFSIKARKK